MKRRGAGLAIILMAAIGFLTVPSLPAAGSEPVFIGAETLRGWMDQQREFVLIDLRDQASFEWTRIPGALNIPAERIDSEIRKFRKKKIVLYCYSQGTSIAVARNFPQYDITVLTNGIIGWEQKGFPVEDK